VGNNMYRLFLDPTMTYSSGIHLPGNPSPTSSQFFAHLSLIAAMAGGWQVATLCGDVRFLQLSPEDCKNLEQRSSELYFC